MIIALFFRVFYMTLVCGLSYLISYFLDVDYTLTLVLVLIWEISSLEFKNYQEILYAKAFAASLDKEKG